MQELELSLKVQIDSVHTLTEIMFFIQTKKVLFYKLLWIIRIQKACLTPVIWSKKMSGNIEKVKLTEASHRVGSGGIASQNVYY